jgi:hypothetical protein
MRSPTVYGKKFEAAIPHAMPLHTSGGIQALFCFDHSATDCKVNAVLVTTKDTKNLHKIFEMKNICF